MPFTVRAVPSGSVSPVSTVTVTAVAGAVVAASATGAGIALPPTLPRLTTLTGVFANGPMPSPSWPNWLSPQHHTLVSMMTAHVFFRPALMPLTTSMLLLSPGSSSRDGATGSGRSVVVPSPIWPKPLSPQQRAKVWSEPGSSLTRAQVWKSPAVICTGLSEPPMLCTCTGTSLLVKLLRPSWPLVPKPQHHTVLSLLRAHVWRAPAVISTTLVSGEKWVGSLSGSGSAGSVSTVTA